MPPLPTPPLMIGPLGMQEMLIILVVALIVFGPRKLPQIGKTLGKSMAEFRRTSNELKSTLEREVQMEEFRDARREVSKVGQDLSDAVHGGLAGDRGAPRPPASTEGGGPAKPGGASDSAPATPEPAASGGGDPEGDPPGEGDGAADDGAARSDS